MAWSRWPAAVSGKGWSRRAAACWRLMTSGRRSGFLGSGRSAAGCAAVMRSETMKRWKPLMADTARSTLEMARPLSRRLRMWPSMRSRVICSGRVTPSSLRRAR